MRARGVLPAAAFAAGVLAASARGSGFLPESGVCELAAADRARTSSHRCVSCHDGSASSRGGAFFQQMRPEDPRSFGHPVEVDYAAAQRSGRGRLAAPEALPPEVVLVGGKVTCTSCHDARSSEPSQLATSYLRLCTSCHQM